MLFTTKVTDKNTEKECLHTHNSDEAIRNLSELVNELEEGQMVSEIMFNEDGAWLTSQCLCEKGGYIRWIHTMDDEAKPFTTNQNVENFSKEGIKQSLFVRPIFDSTYYEITKVINGTTINQYEKLKRNDLDYLIGKGVMVTIQPEKR